MRDFSSLSLDQGLAASGTTALTHLALVHVSWTLVVVGEGDEVGHHTQNAVREELLVSGHSRHHLRLQRGHVHEDLQASNQTTLIRYLLLKGRKQNKDASDVLLSISVLAVVVVCILVY